MIHGKGNLKARKVCVFTGSRAEYGLLKPLMKEIKKDKALKLQIIVSGTHLCSEFGSTYKEIEADGFLINKKVQISLDSDTPTGICKSIGLGIVGFSKAYSSLCPDILVILGDRFEAFAAAAAAVVSRIPIAHINGGEATFGVIDEAMRHSITKMSHLHFTSTEEYRKRVIQLGEYPRNVFNVGATGIDNVKCLQLLSREQLEKDLKFKFDSRSILVTFHPVTLENNTSAKHFRHLLSVLSGLKSTTIIFTKANADTFSRVINEMIDEFVHRHSGQSMVFGSLGYLRYLSLMRLVDVVVGNSSSGIIEAPSLRIATVNIGDRQKGRIRAKSVIDCAPEKRDILRALKLAFSDDFRRQLKSVKNPYSRYADGMSSRRIKEKIKKIKLGPELLKKEFFDINFKAR